jgi:lipopolysaccharide export system permease protein
MKLIDRYLARQVLWYTVLVTGVLAVLGALFDFIDQQREVGTGGYAMLDALFVTLLDAPLSICQLLPLGALIGALLGLGQLARGSELIVLRASGLSVRRMGLAAAYAGLVLFALFWAVGEFAAPTLERYAQSYKAFAKNAEFNLSGSGGAWVKDGNRIFSVDQQSAGDRFAGLYVFELGADAGGRRELRSVAHAGSAALLGEGRWRFDNYAESSVGPAGLTARRSAHELLAGAIDPQFLGLAVVDPDNLTLRDLVGYVAHQRGEGLDARSYEVALWSRLARSLSVILVCVLAVPFVLGPLRSSGAGARLLLGIGIGVVYFLASRTLENSGEAYALNPLVVGFAPTLALAALTLLAVARAR